MLGHQLWRHLHRQHDVWITLRRPAASYSQYELFDASRSILCHDATAIESLTSIFRQARPEAVINCVGIIKQLKKAKSPLLSIAINSLFPHRLAEICKIEDARLVHISTDCVFSGRKGNYSEDDVPDAEDLYGRTKLLGEVHDAHCVTLRTSIIGRELETHSGLIEWFLSQENKTIKGYRRAIYTGFTTIVMARIIENILLQHPDLAGVCQVASNPINKYDLLGLAKDAFDWNGTIVADDDFVCDRSLDSQRFRAQTRFVPPAWSEMIEELAKSPR